jgi:N utilization substance protein B
MKCISGCCPLFHEVIDYASTDADERANKHLPTAEDLKPNLKILEIQFITSLKKTKNTLPR